MDKDATIRRCAIYTRKSLEDSVEKDYNSIDAQRDAGEAYIASQKANGWVCLPDRYDDYGCSMTGLMDSQRKIVEQLIDRMQIAQ